MAKKTGKKANYITYGEAEIRDIVAGHLLGVSLNDSNATYYTMIPKALLLQAKRSKLTWLGRDKGKAVAKFYALVNDLKKQEEIFTETTIEIATEAFSPHDLRKGKVRTNKVKVSVKEAEHIEWLMKELQNPKALAKKTGIEAFNYFHEWMLKKQLKLSTLCDNYKYSVRYSKIKDKDEKKKTESAWNLFLSLLNDKTHVEQITLNDVKSFETYLHKKKYTDKTISHYKNRVSKIIRYNLEKVYIGNKEIRQVLDFFDAWEELDINSSSTIAAKCIEHEDFKTLYDNADLQLKAVLMLCLNTGTYLREVARFKISDINFKEQTLMTQRAKTGNCKKVSYLWDRTIKALQDYLATRKDKSDILFKAAHGGEYKNGEGLRTYFYRLRKNCNLLNIEFNQLRDTLQTLGDEAGVSEYHINLIMGHSTGKSKERYSHRRIHNELKEACLKIEKKFFEPEK